jgi:hypothetical protein
MTDWEAGERILQISEVSKAAEIFLHFFKIFVFFKKWLFEC